MADAWADVEAGIAEIADDWRAARTERQARRHLEPADFARLRDAGFSRTVVPEAMGGLWRSLPETTPRVCGLLRTLGRADPSVALVSAMHPSVVGFWVAPPFDQPAWVEQRDAVIESVREGRQWGTITSEPGSGGDMAKTKSTAVLDPDGAGHLPGPTYLVSGVHVTPFGGGGLAPTVLTYLLVALIFGLVNGIVGTVIRVVAFPLYVLTLGLISFVVNGLLLLLVAWISDLIGFGLSVENFGWGVLGALVLGIIAWLIGILLRPFTGSKNRRS